MVLEQTPKTIVKEVLLFFTLLGFVSLCYGSAREFGLIYKEEQQGDGEGIIWVSLGIFLVLFPTGLYFVLNNKHA